VDDVFDCLGGIALSTRVEENGQTTEITEEDGRITSKKINGVLQAIQ